MKFKFGYWMMKPECEPVYVVEYAGHQVLGDGTLRVWAASKRLDSRGDTLNLPVLTVELRAPAPDVVQVSAVHFAGAERRGPEFALACEEGFRPQVREEEGALVFVSGPLTARVCTKPGQWGMTFVRGGETLTSSDFRCLMHVKNTKEDRCYMVEQLALDVGENIYGFGERFTPFVKNGQQVDIWNEDGGTASQYGYKCVPFYLSSKGYGVFVRDPGDVSFEVASETVERVQFSVPGERLEYCVVGGDDMKGALRAYTGLTGRPALPPAWSFGLWLSTSFTTSYDEATVTSFIDGMSGRGIPLSVFHFDCFWMRGLHWCDFEWDPQTFPDPEGMLRRYHERGLKICVWINSYIAQQSPLFEEGARLGYLLKTEDGGVWQTDLWQAGMALVDFTNPEACRWYQQKLGRLMDMGVDCFKTDFGERVPVRGVRWFDGSDPVRMHNYYTLLYNRTVFELLERRRGKGEAALFARSATAGGQQYPVHWGGDCSAQYVSMAETLRGGLSLAMCGFGFWSHDMGGFENTATPDLYKRWCAFGLLSSHSRLHGSQSYRVPWSFDDEASGVLRHFTRLKCRLMPYLYAQAVTAHREGIPVLRPMALEFPGDETCGMLDRQYLLGENLLVAPIFREDGRVRYYVPQGRWTRFPDGGTVEGPSWREESYAGDYFSLPLLARPDSVIALGALEDTTSYRFARDVELHVYELSDGAEVTVQVPDERGADDASFTVRRAGKRVTVAAAGGDCGAWRVALHQSGCDADGKTFAPEGGVVEIEW